jgi:uncharacterized protein (DUF58 family)
VTPRGISLVMLSVTSLVFGRISGLRELMMAGAAFAAILVVGFGLVWLRQGTFRMQRTVTPGRTTVGRSVRVELVIEASGRLGMGPVLLADRLPPDVGPTPRLALPGGLRTRQRAVAYAVSPRLRGRHAIGPLEVTHTDPFGTIGRRQDVSVTTPLVVYPSYEEVSVLPSAVQRIGIGCALAVIDSLVLPPAGPPQAASNELPAPPSASPRRRRCRLEVPLTMV